MASNFMISFIIGIIIGILLFFPIFGYINKLAKKPIFVINVYDKKIPIDSFVTFILWKVSYPIANKIFNIEKKVYEKAMIASGLEKLKLQFELTEILYKKMPIVHLLVYLAITSTIFWVIYLIVSKTLNNTTGYILGSFIIFLLNIINTIYTVKKQKKIIIT
jgi:hypothetical protein